MNQFCQCLLFRATAVAVEPSSKCYSKGIQIPSAALHACSLTLQRSPAICNNCWPVVTTQGRLLYRLLSLHGHMHCCEAEEVPMRLVGDTTHAVLPVKMSVSRHSKRRAGMAQRTPGCALARRPASHQIAIVRPWYAQRLRHRQRKSKRFSCVARGYMATLTIAINKPASTLRIARTVASVVAIRYMISLQMPNPRIRCTTPRGTSHHPYHWCV
jgi:hypothetical protein